MIEQPLIHSPTAVIGGGTMGTAIAHLLCRIGFPVRMWCFEPDLVRAINEHHRNHLFLPDLPLPEELHATSSLQEALHGAGIVFSVTPSQVIRHIWTTAKPFLDPDAALICASKGIETQTGKLLSEVLDEVLGAPFNNRLAFMSGPSFAREIIDQHPTAVVIASKNAELAETLQKTISTTDFRAYTTDDVIGVELGGAVKNVIAIAVGAAEGLGLGTNTRSALITRGLAEISRLAVACGAHPLTLSGLSGIGDLVLTCTGHLSRNLQVGIRLGKGEPLQQILSSTRMVAEGVETARSTLELACSRNVEMPITRIVVSILDNDVSPSDAVSKLMGRRLRSEKEH